MDREPLHSWPQNTFVLALLTGVNYLHEFIVLIDATQLHVVKATWQNKKRTGDTPTGRPGSSAHLHLGLKAGAAELVHLFDVLLHGVLLGRTLALGPLVKFGLGLLIEEATGPGCGSTSSNSSRAKANTRTHADQDIGGARGASGQMLKHTKDRRQNMRSSSQLALPSREINTQQVSPYPTQTHSE